MPRVTEEFEEQHDLTMMQEKFVRMHQELVVPLFANIPVARYLGVPLDVRALDRSVRELIRRYGALRIRYRSVGDAGQWSAQVATSTDYELHRVELTDLAVGEQLVAARREIESFAATRFSLEYGPRIRVSAITLAQHTHILLFVFDHSAIDGWSAALLERDFDILYAAHSTGGIPALGPVAMQFSEFARRQNEWLEGPDALEILRQWSERVADASDAFWLPTDRTTSVDSPYVRERTSRSIPRSTMLSLQKLGAAYRATPFIVTLAAFVAVLIKWTGRYDTFVRVAHHGRHRAELREVVGCAFDEWYLRAQVTKAPSFTELLQVVRDAYVRNLPMLDFPGRKLKESIPLPAGREIRRVPSFNYIQFNLGSAVRVPGNEQPDAQARYQHVSTVLKGIAFSPYLEPATGLALAVVLVQSSEGLSWAFEYDPLLFEGTTVESLSNSLERVLREVSANPDVPVAQLPKSVFAAAAKSVDQVTRRQ